MIFNDFDQRIDEASSFTYRRVIVPEDMAANVVYMNGTVICKSKNENPDSWKIMEEQLGQYYTLKGHDLSEIEKAVGSLTCMSLRFNRPSKVRAANMQRLVCRYEDD